MIQRHYVPRATQMIRCDRCGLLIQFHRDDRGHWIGCPDGGELSEPRPCDRGRRALVMHRSPDHEDGRAASVTDWFFTWPVIVFAILVVCAARITIEIAEKRAQRRKDDDR
jgi:hypothetical protein